MEEKPHLSSLLFHEVKGKFYDRDFLPAKMLHLKAEIFSTLIPGRQNFPTFQTTHLPFFNTKFRETVKKSSALISCCFDSEERKVRFRPCIDIHKGKVKQIVGSTLRDFGSEGESLAALVTNFESETSAAEFASLYKEDGLHGGHVIMLGEDAASQEAAISALAAFPGGLQVGGGVNPENAGVFLDAGASHVIVTSYVFNQGKMDAERLRRIVETVGRERLVLDLSCRRRDGEFYVVTDRWQRFSDLVVNEETLVSLAGAADEFLVHGVDVEGKRLGIDEELVSLLGKWSTIPVTYAGGARSVDDLERIRDAGNGRVDVTVGSALDIFGGELGYRDVVLWHRQQQNSPDFLLGTLH